MILFGNLQQDKDAVGTYKASVIGASLAEISGCYLLSFFGGHLFGAGNDVDSSKV